MNSCPCCAHQMLRHIRHHQVYWFCRNCWQEMPLLEQGPVDFSRAALMAELAKYQLNRTLIGA